MRRASLAVSLGLSARFGEDDHAVLRHGFVVYDALLAWLGKRATSVITGRGPFPSPSVRGVRAR